MLHVAVPLIARVAVQFISVSLLEVVIRLTTSGGRDILRYRVCQEIIYTHMCLFVM